MAQKTFFCPFRDLRKPGKTFFHPFHELRNGSKTFFRPFRKLRIIQNIDNALFALRNVIG
jgi:hypothetical protein